MFMCSHAGHPAAVPFINNSINHMVGKDRNGQQKPWNFTHHDHHHSERSLGRSLVVDRHKKDKPRLPDHIYNVAA